MISRVAENCWWLMRYTERYGSLARLLRVHHSFLGDVDVPQYERWMPLIIVTGERENFIERYSEADGHKGELVQEYLTWDEHNYSSIYQSIRAVRENARTIREVISQEMWETINVFWHWLTGGQGRRLYRRSRDEFYRRISEASGNLYGVCLSTMIHETSVKFILLGMWLERTSQTARILDVKHHALRPTRGKTVPPEEAAQWSVLLQSLSATEPFFRRTRVAPSAVNVAGFLIYNEEFPRSIIYCLARSIDLLQQIRPDDMPEIGHESMEQLNDLLAALRAKDVDAVVDDGIHDVLTEIVDNVADICQALHDDFFDPPMSVEPALVTAGAQNGVR